MEHRQPARLAVLASRVRLEEKLIFRALEQRGVAYEQLDERALSMRLDGPPPPHAAVLNRSISYYRGLYAARLFEAAGVRVLNSSRVAEVCGDKLMTSLALVRAGLPVPRTAVALTPEAAGEAITEFGGRVVLKPLIGSWGRLLARVDDREGAEAILEHKQALGSPQHSVIYLQEYIDKPGRDIRCLVMGERVVAAMYRNSEHWITNTARGGRPSPCPVTDELASLALRAAAAVGGGVLAVDLLERRDGSLLVNEVNHTVEFHGLMEVCDVDIAGSLVDYFLAEASR